ncbi:MAG TPA: cold-shock protein, partial [Fibrella sp.]
MQQSRRTKLTRIGVFYDGNYFLHVSNYYNYSHERRSRISISGLHAFIRSQVADSEDTDKNLCQIVDAHYFRGRLNAHEASQRGNQLFYDRLFDDILMSEGVVTHYLPVKTYQGYRQEKGIDVWLALETYELAT